MTEEVNVLERPKGPELLTSFTDSPLSPVAVRCPSHVTEELATPLLGWLQPSQLYPLQSIQLVSPPNLGNNSEQEPGRLGRACKVRGKR